jgi:hypothetical protein
LSESYYVEKIFDKFSKGDNSTVKTPIDISIFKNIGKRINQLEYSSIIWRLIYVINYSRPNIAFSISKHSKSTSYPSMDHLKAIQRVLKYLRHIVDYGLHYTSYSAVLKV